MDLDDVMHPLHPLNPFNPNGVYGDGDAGVHVPIAQYVNPLALLISLFAVAIVLFGGDLLGWIRKQFRRDGF